MSDLCVRHLLREHREIEQALAAIESQLEKQARQLHWSEAERKCSKFCTNVLGHYLDRHLRKEEEILLPALEAFLPSDTGPLAVLRTEHSDLRSYFVRMRQAADLLSEEKDQSLVREEFHHAACKMIRILRDEIYKEDRVLFPMVARFISPEQDAALVQQMESVDQELAGGPSPDLLPPTSQERRTKSPAA